MSTCDSEIDKLTNQSLVVAYVGERFSSIINLHFVVNRYDGKLAICEISISE